ncbi:hypothetical protein AVEN_95127-1 [Araneus ventricosus]|uniref:Uncharacterized protein n=1 Tax=Araneus ventricosus TaxID=182803 RepID=A0A4Y2LLB1_ARAVE|nr:hypothetical protein AVEN_95127-1 [Araneus ventricosus]
MKVTSRYQLSVEQDGSNSIFGFITFWCPPNYPRDRIFTVKCEFQGLYLPRFSATDSIYINSNFVASSHSCIIVVFPSYIAFAYLRILLWFGLRSLIIGSQRHVTSLASE